MGLIRKLKHTGLFLLLTTTSLSFAGTSDGGGGVGVRCPAGSSRVAFELLDLHEVQVKGEQIEDKPATMEQAIELAAGKLGNHFYKPSQMPPAQYIDYLKRNVVEKIFKRQSFTNPINGEVVHIEYVGDLALSSDIGDYQIKPGCSLEQIAYYFDRTNTLKIVASRWNELSWVDRAALVSHEIHYFLDRHNGLEDFGSSSKKTSGRARHFVGMLYSKTGVKPKYGAIPTTGIFTCATNTDSSHRNTWFEVFATGANEFTAVFESMQGYSSAYATSSVFIGNTLADITDWFSGKMDSSKGIHIATKEIIPTFSVRIMKAPRESPRFQAFMEKNGVTTPLGPEEELICWNPH